MQDILLKKLCLKVKDFIDNSINFEIKENKPYLTSLK